MSTPPRTRIALFAAVLACALIATAGTGAAQTTDFELSPAKLWIGLSNSDAVGTYVDLKIDAWDADGHPTGFGEIRGVRAGGSGFRGARLVSIDMFRLIPDFGPVPGPPATIQIDARISCAVRGHRSATILLWYNGTPVDTGRRHDAGSRIGYTIGDVPIALFLRPFDVLSEDPGFARVPRSLKLLGPPPGEVCANYQSFGIWSAAE
jgi:hypothetical protein